MDVIYVQTPRTTHLSANFRIEANEARSKILTNTLELPDF